MKAKQKPTGSTPIEIKRGNSSVTIYPRLNRVGGKSYPQFILTYYSGNERVRKCFSDLDTAKREGELAATKLANGEAAVLKLTSADRDHYIQACSALAPTGIPLYKAVDEYVQTIKKLPVGMTLPAAVNEYVQAIKRLPPNVTLLAALNSWLERHPSSMPKKTVQEVVDELLSAKRKAGRSERHVDDLESRLNAFAAAFPMNIGEVTGPKIQKYLDDLALSPATKRNHLRHVTSLIRFGIRRRYLPKDALDELDYVERPEVFEGETEIFTPAELREMLSMARPQIIPWLAIGAFCGLRSAELMRLDWAQVNLERRFIEVKATRESPAGEKRKLAKTASRRIVPLCDAAIAWLTPHRKLEGPIAYYSEENKFHSAAVADVTNSRLAAIEEAEMAHDEKTAARMKALPAFTWKRNGLRHSFCSYRLAFTHDAAKTALEAGNSTAMIFRHYNAAVTEDEGKAWFGVMPNTKDNVIVIKESDAASGEQAAEIAPAVDKVSEVC